MLDQLPTETAPKLRPEGAFWGDDEVGRLLRMNPRTLRNGYSLDASSMPPCILIGWTRLFDPEVVVAWVKAEMKVVAPPKRRGRPRKTTTLSGSDGAPLTTA